MILDALDRWLLALQERALGPRPPRVGDEYACPETQGCVVRVVSVIAASDLAALQHSLKCWPVDVRNVDRMRGWRRA